MTDPIQNAIKTALLRHGSLGDLIRGDIDPVSVAIHLAEAAGLCQSGQEAQAARYLIAAEAIRRLQHAETAALINRNTILEMRS